MVRLIALTLVAVVLAVAAVSSPRSATAEHLTNWPPLLNCPDVNANTGVDMGDIFAVAAKFGTSYPDNDYLLLYDVDGGGHVTIQDIFHVAGQFGQVCPLIETQAAQAALATVKYLDPAQAEADGYTWFSQYVPQMGVHLINEDFQRLYPDFESQLEHPVGLLYTETEPGSNQPADLIGLWYNLPVGAVCTYYEIAGPCQSNADPPIGFGLTNDDEDNVDPPGIQFGWHTHPGLCSWNLGSIDAFLQEYGPDSEQTCIDDGGQIWFSTYGWMAHLYTIIPNPAGRFQGWNVNPGVTW